MGSTTPTPVFAATRTLVDYKDLVEAVIRRQLGVLGKKRLAKVLKDVNLSLDGTGKLSVDECSIDDLDRLMQALKKRYGAIAVLGCKISIGRMARDNKLKLPPILR